MKRLLIFVIVVGTFLLAPIVAQADVVTFTGGAGTTDWNTKGNWSPARVPTQSDDVTIPSGQTVTNKPFAALGTGFINSLTLLGTLTIDTSGLSLQSTTATSTVNNLTLTSSQGIYSQLTMQGPTTFGNLALSPGVVIGNGAATVNGPVTVSTGNSSLAPASVVNKGSITVTQNNLQVTLGTSSFVNDGSIALQGDGITILGSGTFTNSGSIAKSMGTGTSILSPSGPFNNIGTIAAQSGRLQLSIAGTNTGAFNASAGAILQFANAITLNGGTTFEGSGTIDITAGGVWDVEALVTVDTPNLTFNGQTATMVRGNSNLIINSASVVWNSGVLGAQTGSKVTLTKGVTMAIVTSGYHGLAMDLDLLGTVNMSADLQLSEPTITIEANAQFNILTDNGIHGRGDIDNGGIFQKNQGNYGSYIDYYGTFNITAPKGSHPVNVNTGSIIFAVGSGGVLRGTWTVGAGSTLEFNRGNYALKDGSEFIGGGTIFLFSGTNWSLTGNVAVKTEGFVMNATVFGAFDFTLLSEVIVLDGARTGEIQNGKPVGTIKIPRASSDVTVDQSLTLDACTLDNFSSHFLINPSSGTVVVQDSAVLLNEKGGIIYLQVNQGVNTPAVQVNSGSFSNLGTVTMGATGTNTTQTIGGNLPWTNDGNLIVPEGYTLSVPKGYVNLGGATTIKGGTIILGGPMDLEGGTLDGTGSVNGTPGINNNGATLEAGPPGSKKTGVLGLNVPLTQGTGAAITALISGTKAGTQYDQINSTSSMVLAGTLNLQFGKGFTPTPSESFNILNFSSVTGGFSTVNAPTGFTAHLNLTSTALIVTFTSGHSVSIQPKAATVMVDGMSQFTGAASMGNGVRWSVTESGGGTVTQTGLYTAPATPGTYHVVVTSVADKTKSDTATVTVTALVANRLTITPQAAILQPGAVLRLLANQPVVWSVSEGNAGGRVTAEGSYTAPQKSGLYQVVATSANESTNHAVINIVVGNGKLKSAYVADVDHNSISVLSGLSGDDASSGSATGQLREIESLASGQQPLALAISPDGKLLLSANENSNDISLFALSDSVLGVLPGNSFAVGAQPSSVKFDPSGRLVFVTNKGSDDLSVFSVDASGQLIFLRSHALAVGDRPSDVAVHPGGSMVYVINAGANGVRGFAYDAAGMLKPVDGSGGDGSPIAAGTGPEAAVIDSAGKFLFVANRGSSDVSVFAIDRTNQTLQDVSGSPFKAGKGAAAIAIDITGSYLFVADHEANDVVSFQIDSETGALTPRGRTSLIAAGPSSLAVDPSGQYVYVTSDQTGGVTILKLNVATGELALSGTTMSKRKTSFIVLTGSAATPAQAP